MKQRKCDSETKVESVIVSKSQSRETTGIAVPLLGISTIASFPLLSDSYIFIKIPIIALCLAIFIIYSHFKISNYLQIRKDKVLLLVCGFLTSLVISGFITETNWTRLLWGESGRNNGLITWLLLCITLLITIGNLDQVYSPKFFWSLIAFIALCEMYFLLQYFGLNIFNETFTYSPMVGFFGNPNFTSAFLGMLFATTLGLAVFYTKARVFTGLLSILSLIEIYFTKSLQGFMMAGAAGFFYLYALGLRHGVSKKILTLYLGMCASIFTTGLFGLLGVGPLGNFLERNSFRSRLGYFESAISMWTKHPIAGVGTDSYGDFYREFRPDWVISTVNDASTSNDAHNIYLNLLATSGLFAFLFYVLLNFYSIYLGFLTLRKRSVDVVIVIALAVTISFQLQSLISINHLGIAIWNWFAMGVVIARSYTILLPNMAHSSHSKGKRQRMLPLLAILVLSAVVIAGFMRLGEGLKLKSVAGNMVVGGSQEYKEQKFIELASISGYWISDVANSMHIQEAFLNLGASEAAETISKATYAFNPNSRDALWALVAIQTRRGNFVEAIALREKLIEKEKESSWVLLDQAESYAELKNKIKADEYLNKARTKPGVDPVRVASLQTKIDEIP